MLQLVWNSSLGTGLGDDGELNCVFYGITSSPRVSVVRDAKPDFSENVGGSEILISREPRVQKCTNLFGTLHWAQG